MNMSWLSYQEEEEEEGDGGEKKKKRRGGMAAKRERTTFEKAFQHFEVQKAFYIFNETLRQFAAVFMAKNKSEVKTWSFSWTLTTRCLCLNHNQTVLNRKATIYVDSVSSLLWLILTLVVRRWLLAAVMTISATKEEEYGGGWHWRAQDFNQELTVIYFNMLLAQGLSQRLVIGRCTYLLLI